MKNTKTDVAKVRELYSNKELSPTEIAKKLGITTASLYRILYREGIEVRQPSKTHIRGEAYRRYSNVEEERIANKYLDGSTLSELASEFKMCIPAIKKLLLRRGVTLRKQGSGGERVFSPNEVKEIIGLYESGMSQDKISQKFRTHQTKISRLLKTNGIASKYGSYGKDHPSWKGGSYMHASGYKYVFVDREDPLRVMTNGTGYVFEHRLVMARHLGRPLEEYEYVHHINGVRDDNRLENLQLVRSQPKGQILYCADCGSKNLVPEEF